MIETPVTIQEVMAHEKPSLTEIIAVVLEYLHDRKDVVVVGAHAVNEYVNAPRATADIDVVSTDADHLVQELCKRIHDKLYIAARVRQKVNGLGFRIYRLREGDNQHLVDVRAVDALPSSHPIDGVLVVNPEDLVVMKLVSFVDRRNTPKGISDRLDLHRLLLTYPEYRAPNSPIEQRLYGADPKVVAAWDEILAERITDTDDDEY